MVSIEQRLRYLREVQGMSQSKIANKLGFNQSAWQKYETGARAIPTRIINDLISLYGISSDWLLTGKGEMFDSNKLSPDERWKRMIILRNSIQHNNGNIKYWAKSLGVSTEQYIRWEHNLAEIPREAIDAIYKQVKPWVRKEWWYEGKGEIYKNDAVGSAILLTQSEDASKDGLIQDDPANYRSRPLTDIEEIQDLIDTLWRESGSTKIKAYVLLLASTLQKIGLQINNPE